MRLPPPDSIARYRLSVASRVAAAFIGGYLLTTLLTALLSYLLPGPRAQALLIATLFSFAIYTGLVVWAFSVSTSTRAWRGMLVASCVSGAALLLVQHGLA
ncbi:MAG: iron transporter [Steroidobacteraceae bacterium]